MESTENSVLRSQAQRKNFRRDSGRAPKPAANLRTAPRRLSFGFASAMKTDIHPDYNETEISCACGAVYHTRSTRKDIKIGICAACHPFFTGEQKFVDTAGRVEKFARRYGSTKATRATKK